MDDNPEVVQRTKKGIEYSSILHTFVEQNNLKLLKKLFQEIQEKVKGKEIVENVKGKESEKTPLLTRCIKKRNEKGYTYLAVAVKNIKCKTKEITKQMDRDATDTLECMRKIFGKEMVSTLCKEKDNGSNSLFHLAVQKSLTELMTFMLSITQNVHHIFNEDGHNPLHLAVQTSSTEIIKRILEQQHFNTNEPMNNGETALHIAAQLGDSSSLEALIEQGGDLSIRDKDGHTPLHDCLQKVYFEGVPQKTNVTNLSEFGTQSLKKLLNGGA